MRIFKEIAYWCCVLTGLTWVAARVNRRKLLVLAYHDVYGGAPDPVGNFDGLRVHRDRFVRQMQYLAEHYDVVTLDALLDQPVQTRHAKPVAAITFDDGYRDTYHHAYPVLRRFRLPATVFIVTDLLRDGRALWWDRLRALVAAAQRSLVRVRIHTTNRQFRLVTIQDRQVALRELTRILRRLPPGPREDLLSRLAIDLGVEERQMSACASVSGNELTEMAAGGIAVGSHGCSHESFLHMGGEVLLGELVESKRVLESLLGRPVTWVSYPYGDCSPQMAELVLRAGYRGAVTTVEGLNEGVPDPCAVRRIGVNDQMTFVHFVVAVSGLRDFLKDLWGVRWGRRSLAALARLRPERRYAADARHRGPA